MRLNWIGRLLIVAVLTLGWGTAYGQDAGASSSQPAAAPAGITGPFVVPSRGGDVNSAPLEWSGLWETATDDNGSFLSCTGQFITDDIVLMAAHCVRDRYTGQYYDTGNGNDLGNSFFLLQWENNKYSDVYHPVCEYTYNGWLVALKDGETEDNPAGWSQATLDAVTNSWQWDFAMMKVDHKSITGHYNYAVNSNADFAVGSGYPAAPLGNAAVIELDPGDVLPTSEIASVRNTPSEQVLWHGNTAFTQGASGGAWISNFDSRTVSPKTNVVVGLNSFILDSRPGAMFGPVFTKYFDQLVGIVSKCGAK
jgi:hypothetical protein